MRFPHWELNKKQQRQENKRGQGKNKRNRGRIICIYDNVFVECFGCRWLFELWLLLNISNSFKQADLQHWCFRKRAGANRDWGGESLAFNWPRGLISHNPVLLLLITYISTFTVNHFNGTFKVFSVNWIHGICFPVFLSAPVVSLYSKWDSGSVFLNYCCDAAAALGTTGKERMSPEVLWEK